jgi:hypothetical protein
MVFSNIHFPLAIQHRDQKAKKIPALFTTESSGLSRGVKVKTIARDQNDQLIEIISPAKLRFRSEKGCKPLDNPTQSLDGTPSFDYFCGNKILRLKLRF